MIHNDVIIGHVVTSSVKLHQEASIINHASWCRMCPSCMAHHPVHISLNGDEIGEVIFEKGMVKIERRYLMFV